MEVLMDKRLERGGAKYYCLRFVPHRPIKAAHPGNKRSRKATPKAGKTKLRIWGNRDGDEPPPI